MNVRKAKQAKPRKILCSGLTNDKSDVDHAPNPGQIDGDGGICVECGGFVPNEPSAAMSEASTPNFLRSSHTSECNDANDRSANEICLCDERSEYQMLKDHLAQSLKREERLRAVNGELVNHLRAAIARLKEFGGVKVKAVVDYTSDLETMLAKAESEGKEL
jgi:hypothetical protein